MPNTLEFIVETMKTLDQAGIRTWLFGGWAEEVWQIIPPRPHHDLDLLFLGTDFHPVDAFLSAASACKELRAKRFSHKRAFLCEDTLVELIRVEEKEHRLETTFFNDGCTLVWPEDTFQFTCPVKKQLTPIASPNTLKWYRSQHAFIESAYRKYLQKEQLHIAFTASTGASKY